jgi:ABC-type multidrug transport system fused ATPase/permease subunit
MRWSTGGLMSSVDIQSELEFPGSGSVWPLGRRLIVHAVRSAPTRVALLLGLGALYSMLEGASIVFLLPVLASLGIGQAGSSRVTEVLTNLLHVFGLPYTLATSLGFVFVVGVITAAVDLLHTIVADSTERQFARNMQIDVYRALAGSMINNLSRQRAGHTTAVLTKFSEQAAIAFVRMVRVFTGSIAGLVLIGLALAQAWQFVVAAIFLLAILSWPVWRASQSTYHLVLEAQKQVRRVWVLLAEELRLLPTTKAFGAEARSIEKVTAEVTRAETMVLAIRRRIAAVRSSTQPILIGLLCIAVYVGVTVFAVPLDRLFLLVGVFIRLMPTIMRVIGEGQDLPILLVAHDEVERFIKTSESATEREGGVAAPEELHKGIRLTDVTVTDDDTVILNGVSLFVSTRSITALVGESGSGKTTIATTVLGLTRPSAGSVEIDGFELHAMDLMSWRKRVGYVSQDAVVFGRSIRENLLFAVPDATDEQMFAALDSAGVGQFVRSLPEGLDTHVGEWGSLISGGERQRIAIARALLRDPMVLILDEGTSALDPETTQQIRAMLEHQRRTRALIIIAHDLDMVRQADMIYVVEKGRIIEQGNWDDLVQKRGQLFKMALLQGRLT